MENTEKEIRERKKKNIKKMGWMVASAVVFAFALMQWVFIFVLGIKIITMDTSVFMFVITFYPLATFFLGMAMIMKKKIVPFTERHKVDDK